MKREKYLIPSLLAGSALGLAINTLAKQASATPALARPSTTKPKLAPATPQVQDTSYSAIDDYVQQQMRRLNIPGAALAVVAGDQIVHFCSFGRANPAGDAPTPQTPFFIGSVTKSFTALAVMQLVEAGKVALDARVQRYLPWFRVADPWTSAQITVRHLLNQTSSLPMLPGMAELSELDNRPGVAERQVRALRKLRLSRPVGSAFEYSNINYNLLGLIIEAASGESYTSYIQRHILHPLNMRHTYTSLENAQPDGLAAGYRMWFGLPVAAPNLSVPAGSLAAGGLISCTEDLCHYLIALLNKGCYLGMQIISEASIAEMHRPVAKINEMGLSLGHYAMGWISQRAGEVQILYHTGDVPNFKGSAALVPEQNKGLVLLFNANNAIIKITLDEVMYGAAQRLAGVSPEPIRFDALVWVMRLLPLIPLLQTAGVAATLRQLHRWRQNPARRPSHERMWWQHILLPLVPNLLVSLTLIPMLSKMRGFITLFTPDLSWIARICGSFALVWSFLRTGLVLRALGKPSSHEACWGPSAEK